jgi:hypothetical protein
MKKSRKKQALNNGPCNRCPGVGEVEERMLPSIQFGQQLADSLVQESCSKKKISVGHTPNGA